MDTADRGGRRGSLAALPNSGKSKSIVDIKLNDEQKGCFVPSYTTLEKIEGTVFLKCPIDVPFDDLHITFQGSSRTYVEKLASTAPTNPRTQAFHNFLRLAQPIDPQDLPENKIARAGVEYRFPFTFVVPDRLLPQACNHRAENAAVHEAHLALPPSLGDPMMAGDGKSLLDDMSPANTIISYGLRVFMFRKPGVGQTRPTVLIDRIKKLRIIPAVEEAAPLRILGGKTDDYVPIKTRTLKRGMFKGKLGALTVAAAQPKALVLQGLRSGSTCPVTTMATVKLRFDPADVNSKPPRLGSLISKLKISTYYSSAPTRSFPSKMETYFFDSQKGAYMDTITLSCRNVESAQWHRHNGSERRDSAISLSCAANRAASWSSSSSITSSDEGSVDNKGLPFYTADILVPVELPTSSRSFVPTFHSCLISRTYMLDLVLTVHSSSPTVSASNLHLKVPLQIAAEGNADATPIISDEEAASIARREADGLFVPRSVAPPESEETVIFPRGARGSIFTASRVGSVSSGRVSMERRPGHMEDIGEPPRYSAFIAPMNAPLNGPVAG